VNVRTPLIAGDGEVKLKDRERTSETWAWDEKLTLEFNNSRPAICAIEITRADELPTIFLLGDSTVCDQPLEPYNSWGQMLTRFFKPGIAIANHAESGESLRSSLGAKRLDKVLSLMKQKRRSHTVSDESLELLANEAMGLSHQSSERFDALEECLAKLTAADRELLQERYFRQRPPKQIAAIQSRSVHSVYRALSRIHNVLLNCVQRHLKADAT